MLFPVIKNHITKKEFSLSKPFLVKSKFIDLEFKKRRNYKNFRVDYSPLVEESNYKSLIRRWYLLLAIRTANSGVLVNKSPVFSYRRTKLFAKYQESYDVSFGKYFYETLVEHRNLFYCLVLSTYSVDKLYLILCLYSLKTKAPNTTVIKKSPVSEGFYKGYVDFILKRKWKFKIVNFT
jgi:hypothetical protein